MKKKGNSKFSKINAWIHLWPSIVAGIVLVFVCLTGTIVVYENELYELSAGRKALYVEPNGERLSIDKLIESYRKELPKDNAIEIVLYKDPKRSIRFIGFSPNEEKLYHVYMNPYTGKILKKDYSLQFIFIMAHLHGALLMGKVGGWIVAVSTIIFTLSTITGMILWWPKKWNKTNINNSFKIKWRARFKRLNYDLHNVFGFYTSILCFVLALTGLILFFEPMMTLTVKAFGGEDVNLSERTKDFQLDKDKTYESSFCDSNLVIEKAFEMYPNKNHIRCSLYEYENISVYPFFLGSSIGIKSQGGMEILFFDKFTGKIVYYAPKLKKAAKINNVIWQLHMGNWWGQFGKLSTFIAGIVATSLPITGFLVWWGRRKKKKK